MFAALNDTEAAALVWMPAHTKESDVGQLCLGDGSKLTHFDRKGNHEADKLAKLAVEAHRVPTQVRDRIEALNSLVEKTARWVARATYIAGHQTVKPLRDTDASRAAAVAAGRLKTPLGRARRGRWLKRGTLRPAALGGHRLWWNDEAWVCKKCKRKSKTYTNIAPTRCNGSAVVRWEVSARAVAQQGVPDSGGHSRVVSGDILWCSTCGSYASTVARNLARPCPGRFQGCARGGLAGQLKVLKSGRHPVTLRALPPPVPVAKASSPDDYGDPQSDRLEAGVEKPLPRNSKPQVHAVTAAERRAAILQRVRAKESAGKLEVSPDGAAEVTATRRRIAGKRPGGVQLDADAGVLGAASKRHKFSS
jgi:hypothetical protein